MSFNPVQVLRKGFKRTTVGKRMELENLKARFGEASDVDLAIMQKVKPFTMTSWERLWALLQAVRYVESRGIEGDFVECGVWRGGSSMAAAEQFRALGNEARTLWLFDTFEGMNKPTDDDRVAGAAETAHQKWEETRTGDDSSTWCAASLEDVQNNLARTAYRPDGVRYVKGKVEDTLLDAANIPDKISLLRLDTDWYESTRAEMEILFDRLQPGGVLILDDYGHWLGARKAVDEFLATRPAYLMNRIDNSGRMLIKH